MEGQLSDAIREHLELKRRHGADEEELARQEAEALAPVRRDTASDEDGGSDGLDEETSLMPLPDGSRAPADELTEDEELAGDDELAAADFDEEPELGLEDEPLGGPDLGGGPVLAEEAELDEEADLEEEALLDDEPEAEEAVRAQKLPNEEAQGPGPVLVEGDLVDEGAPVADDLDDPDDPAEVFPEPHPAVPDGRMEEERQPVSEHRPLIDEAPVVHDEPIADDSEEDEPVDPASLAHEPLFDDALSSPRDRDGLDLDAPRLDELDSEEPGREEPPLAPDPDDEPALDDEHGPDDLADFGPGEEPVRPPARDPGDSSRFDFDD